MNDGSKTGAGCDRFGTATSGGAIAEIGTTSFAASVGIGGVGSPTTLGMGGTASGAFAGSKGAAGFATGISCSWASGIIGGSMGRRSLAGSAKIDAGGGIGGGVGSAMSGIFAPANGVDMDMGAGSEAGTAGSARNLGFEAMTPGISSGAAKGATTGDAVGSTREGKGDSRGASGGTGLMSISPTEDGTGGFSGIWMAGAAGGNGDASWAVGTNSERGDDDFGGSGPSGPVGATTTGLMTAFIAGTVGAIGAGLWAGFEDMAGGCGTASAERTMPIVGREGIGRGAFSPASPVVGNPGTAGPDWGQSRGGGIDALRTYGREKGATPGSTAWAGAQGDPTPSRNTLATRIRFMTAPSV